MSNANVSIPVVHQSDEQIYLTLDEVAQRLKCSRSMAHKLARGGEFPSVTVGRFIRVSHRDLEAYLASKLGGYYEPNVEIFRVEHVTRRIHYERSSTYTMAGQQKIPSFKIASMVRIAATQLDAYRRGQYTPVSAPNPESGENRDKINRSTLKTESLLGDYFIDLKG